MSQQPDQDWLDRPRNVRRIVRLLALVCLLLAVADLFYVKRVHLAIEGWFDFHGIFGFLAYVFLVLTAKQWRRVVRRPEDYYD